MLAAEVALEAPLRIHIAEKHGQIKPQRFPKYEYGHLGGLYNKSALYTRFLNLNKIVEKIK